jgi:predicted nucleic acid-binding protein
MSMLFVIDTSSFIDYFDEVFGKPSLLSQRARKIISWALDTTDGEIKLAIPSIVLVEIFEKWLRNEEFLSKFYYEVYCPIGASPNIEIKPIEREVLEQLLKIDGKLLSHDIHDKIILSSAMMLNCPLITKDQDIIEYVSQHHIIPGTLN